MRGDDTSPTQHIVAQLLALSERESGDVGQYENAIPTQQVRIQRAIVDHLERDTRFDESLIIAIEVVSRDSRASVRRSGTELLGRGDYRYAREIGGIAQVAFVLPVPVVDACDHGHPASVDWLGIELDHPRPESLRNAAGNPDPDLRFALHGVLPAVRFLKSHAEDSADWFLAHCHAADLCV